MKLALICFACLSVGACIGYLTAALMFIARESDSEAERAEPKEPPE